MVNYQSYGEASDYMLGKHDIFSFSPELGSGKKSSDDFFISKQDIDDVLTLNYKIIEQFIDLHKLQFNLKDSFKNNIINIKIDNTSFRTINNL